MKHKILLEKITKTRQCAELLVSDMRELDQAMNRTLPLKDSGVRETLPTLTKFVSELVLMEETLSDSDARNQ